MNKEAEKWDDDDTDVELEDDDDDDDDDLMVETVVLTEVPITDGGADTAELQVDALIAQVEAQSAEEIRRRKMVRQRLEELSERRSLDDTFEFDIEDAD